MLRNLLVFIGFLMVVGCAEKTIEPPKDLIDQQTMEEILYDLALLTAGKNTNILTLDKYRWAPTSFVFRKYDIDSIRFVNSDVYYASIPELYETMYTNIDKRFGTLKDSLEDQRKILAETKRKRRLDSVKAANPTVGADSLSVKKALEKLKNKPVKRPTKTTKD